MTDKYPKEFYEIFKCNRLVNYYNLLLKESTERVQEEFLKALDVIKMCCEDYLKGEEDPFPSFVWEIIESLYVWEDYANKVMENENLEGWFSLNVLRKQKHPSPLACKQFIKYDYKHVRNDLFMSAYSLRIMGNMESILKEWSKFAGDPDIEDEEDEAA